MANERNTTKLFIRDNAFRIFTISVLALNTWFAYKLGPIVLNQRLLDQRVFALEDSNPVPKEYLNEVVIKRLDRFESKIDKILENQLIK